MAVVACPTCSKKVEWITSNAFRPFCSQRCKQIDLGAWATEKYAIPVVSPADLQDEEMPD